MMIWEEYLGVLLFFRVYEILRRYQSRYFLIRRNDEKKLGFGFDWRHFLFLLFLFPSAGAER